MAKPFSMDLRERAVSAVVNEGMSCHKAASRFGIGVSTLIAWVRQFRETGSVAPGQMGGHKPKTIRGEHESWLRQRIRGGEFTLRGLVAELAARGLMASFGAVYRFVHVEKLSFKKNRARQRAGSPRRRAPAGAVAGLSESD